MCVLQHVAGVLWLELLLKTNVSIMYIHIIIYYYHFTIYDYIHCIYIDDLYRHMCINTTDSRRNKLCEFFMFLFSVVLLFSFFVFENFENM